MELLERVEAERIGRLRRRGEFFWLDLLRPSGDDLDALAQLLDLSPFAIEDDKEFEQRPKVDRYGDRAFVVFYGAGESRHLAEVHLHVSGEYVVSVRRERCDALERTWQVVRDSPPGSEIELVFRILDALADSVTALVDAAEQRVTELEERAFSAPDEAVRREIGLLRAELFRMQQVVGPQRDMLAAGGELLEQLPGLEGAKERHPFREVHDALVQASNRIEYLREMLGEALGVYLSTKANRLTSLATRLAILGTVFLPLTFVTGFFGQNFGWLVDHIRSRDAFLVWTIGPTAVVLGAALVVTLLSTRRR
jgi:magnesium transporter